MPWRHERPEVMAKADVIFDSQMIFKKTKLVAFLSLHSSVGQSARLVSARSPVRTWVEATIRLHTPLKEGPKGFSVIHPSP